MDYSVFSRDDFDVNQWAEQVIESSEATENPEAYTSGVVMKLQLLMQEIDKSLNEESQKMVQSMPRLTRQLQSITADADRFSTQIVQLKGELNSKMGAPSVARLSRLECVKQRMEQTRQSLRETDNWTTLSADVEEVLESGTVEQLVEKAAALQASLRALQHVTDCDERLRVLDTLRDRVEVVLGPQLEQAFCSLNQARSQQLCQMMTRVGRADRLAQLFSSCLLQQLQLFWQQLPQQQRDDLQLLLATLTSQLVTVWHAQVRFVEQVLPGVRVAELLLTVFADTLVSLDPSLRSCFDGAIKESDDALLLLDNCRQTVLRFLLTLQQLVDSHTAGTSCTEEFNALVRCAHAPFVPQLKRYSRLQQEVLLPALRSLLAVPVGCDLAARLDTAAAAVTPLSSLLHAAIDRCVSLSAGCCVSPMIDAFQVVYAGFAGHCTDIGKQLEARPVCITSGDWQPLHHCLRLLQAVGELMAQTDELEQRILTLLSSSAAASSAPTAASSPTSASSSAPTAAAAPAAAPPLATPLLTSDTSQLARLLLDSDDFKLHRQMALGVQSDNLAALPLAACRRRLATLAADSLHTLLAVVATPARALLTALGTASSSPAGGGDTATPSLTALSAALPDFSYTPQEYMTQVGQYLMTLPQHMEPFMAQHDTNLALALAAARQLQNDEEREEEGVAPSGGGGRGSESEASGVQHVLAQVAAAVCRHCVAEAVQIERLSPAATRQLATDLEYLINVLDDLGQRPSASLSFLLTLLRCPIDQLMTSSTASDQSDQTNAKLSPRHHQQQQQQAVVVDAVRRMRLAGAN